ncbi:acid-resistance membrane protein [Aquisphaera giovannonii]|uniref:Acid-resistance membrane protein n=1 Tax=Aquisphaera giovannonii TaxID=406548 RepID=A0A5B9WER0_9BACT|nr:HdeD family acid-resistance protein [Aquisphaera giovannonii]QEH39138.1 acid-resistance membrane protein [Aquisphaera giovannonii]
MSLGNADPNAVVVRRVLRHELEAIRGNWPWLLALGIVLVVVGTLAIGAPLLASLATSLTIGVFLLIGGGAQLVGAFWTRDWSGFFLVLLMGVLYAVLGLLFIRQPVQAAAALTLLVACALMVGGLFRIIGALTYRFPHWGWVLLGGLLNLFLGILIWMEWPGSALWVIGLFVGIDMLFTGWTWIMLSLRLRGIAARHPPHPSTTATPPPASA